MSFKFNIAFTTTSLLAFILFSCTDSSQVKDGLKIVHYPGTEIIHQEIEMKNGKKSGYAKEFYRDGTLKIFQHYINDTLNDSSIYYHPNGRIASIQLYRDNKKEGIWRDYNKQGKLVSEISFKNNYFDGTSVKYSYRSVKMLTRLNFKEGRKDGLEEKFHADGSIQSKCYFKDGNPCIGLEEWNKKGVKIDNNFKIFVTEVNEVLLKNSLTYYIHLEDPQPGDEVYRVYGTKEDNCLGSLYPIKKVNDKYVLDFQIQKNGFILEEITIAAFRKTSYGNTFIKLHKINVASNNF